ncbi:MAG: hypothetical protein E7496_09755 [Ruminococcus sp.]|nr:hypothetical protein [Ruminococcus sp.]
MAVYLIDYENVYIDGLQGIEKLTEQDSVHIFYTQNRCGLTFALYQQLISCKAEIHLNEVAMSLKNNDPVKNALDIQLMMFVGYVIGTKQSEQIYIISKDKDFRLGLEFYQNYIQDDAVRLQIRSSVEASFHDEETEPEVPPAYENFISSLRETVSQEGFMPEEVISMLEQNQPDSYQNQVRLMLGKNADDKTVKTICEIIAHADTLTELNNGLSKAYHDGQKVKDLYHKCKPKFEMLQKLAKQQNL